MNDTTIALNQYFIQDFEKLKNEMVWGRESILFVTDCSFARPSATPIYGYIVIPSDRLIGMVFSYKKGRYSRPTLHTWPDVEYLKNFPIALPLTSPLTENEYQPPYHGVVKLSISDIQRIEKYKDLEVTLQGQRTKIIRLHIETKGTVSSSELLTWPVFFDSSNGERAYAILKAAAQRIAERGLYSNDIKGLLTQLSELHAEKLITDEEFEVKRKELLSRI
ncbi:MAG TPA: SHOCT domain-containing protein [Anaerolineae bacterium]|nr:SHOCT domain-containing protein [Anaerolineae bacterium]